MIMADLLENAPPEKQQEFIDNLKLGLSRLEWLAAALLKMAKLDAKAVEFDVKEIDSRVLIEMALEPVSILLELKNQKIEIEGQANVLCDERWTSEALSNIIKNASEYSPSDATIFVKVGKNPISAWIAVTDAGEGLSPKEIPKLFERFKGSRSEKGYGIGLPLAETIMRSQNGDIEIDGGGQGKGATFTLKIFHGL